jgi:hypothetical protein
MSGMIVIPASLRSDFIHMAGMTIHIALESTIHIAGIRSYQTVKRYVRKLRGNQPLQPRAVILTGPGEDYGECRVMVRDRLEGRSDQQQLGGWGRQRFP